MKENPDLRMNPNCNPNGPNPVGCAPTVSPPPPPPPPPPSNPNAIPHSTPSPVTPPNSAPDTTWTSALAALSASLGIDSTKLSSTINSILSTIKSSGTSINNTIPPNVYESFNALVTNPNASNATSFIVTSADFVTSEAGNRFITSVASSATSEAGNNLAAIFTNTTPLEPPSSTPTDTTLLGTTQRDNTSFPFNISFSKSVAAMAILASTFPSPYSGKSLTSAGISNTSMPSSPHNTSITYGLLDTSITSTPVALLSTGGKSGTSVASLTAGDNSGTSVASLTAGDNSGTSVASSRTGDNSGTSVASTTPPPPSQEKENGIVIAGVSASLPTLLCCCVVACCLIRRNREEKQQLRNTLQDAIAEVVMKDPERGQQHE